MEITKIAITGGPCGGKTTALERIRQVFTEKGYNVLLISEVATELLTGGVVPQTVERKEAFQKNVMRLQLETEKVFCRAAKDVVNAEKTLIVCDRGIMDSKAFMTEAAFLQTLEALKLNETEAKESYDAVFHLVTAAKGAEKYYTLANNSARTETPEEAVKSDDRTLAAWSGHPYFRMIDNAGDFEDKLKRLIEEITLFLK